MNNLLRVVLLIACTACVAVESESPDLQVLQGSAADVTPPLDARELGGEAAWLLLESRGSAALLGGRYAEAHAAFASVPPARLSAEAWPVAARAALLADAPRIARRLLQRHLRAQPDDAVARLDLARALLLLDAPEAALKQLALLPPARARAPAVRELRGVALLALGEAARALAEFRALLAEGVDDARVRRLAERAADQLRAAARAELRAPSDTAPDTDAPADAPTGAPPGAPPDDTP